MCPPGRGSLRKACAGYLLPAPGTDALSVSAARKAPAQFGDLHYRPEVHVLLTISSGEETETP